MLKISLWSNRSKQANIKGKKVTNAHISFKVNHETFLRAVKVIKGQWVMN